jgi:drug/metabolite transporter (DMT)-like permease
MLAAALLWGVMELTAGLLVGHYSAFEVVWLRYAVHLSLMFVVWGWRNPSLLWRTKRPFFQLSRSALMVGMPTSWIVGSKLGVSTAEMLSVFWLSPLILLFFAWWVLREQVPSIVWSLAGLSWVGVIFLMQPTFETSPHLLLFPLAMAVCFAAYVVMTRSLRTEARCANLFYTALGPFIVFTPLMMHVWVPPPPSDVLYFLGIGIMGFLGLYAIDIGAAVAPVCIGATAFDSQLIFAAAVMALVARQTPTILELVGILLLSITVAWAWVRAPYLRVLEGK